MEMLLTVSETTRREMVRDEKHQMAHTVRGNFGHRPITIKRNKNLDDFPPNHRLSICRMLQPKKRVPFTTGVALLAVISFLCLSAFYLWSYVSNTETSGPSWDDESNTSPPLQDILPPPDIPNIVHFVHIVHTHATNNPLEFDFHQFIAIYSAYYYLRPDTIYIHTNTDPKVVKRAKQSPSKWTRVIANLPPVVFNYEYSPNETTSGKPIVKLPNQSDFVRTRVMEKWGGIYLDEDAYIIKNLGSLRRAGYRNVVGRQYLGAIACGMWLSVPRSDLVTAYHALQDIVFNGTWSTHSVDLFTRVALEYSGKEKEVLILEEDAFFPLGWMSAHFNTLYQVHDGEYTEPSSSSNVASFIQSFKMDLPKTWVRDWRNSYAVHGFNSGLHMYKSYFGAYGGITVAYVVARNSNFARAVYPAVKHAIDNGVI
jgi:hypothetical protein